MLYLVPVLSSFLDMPICILHEIHDLLASFQLYALSVYVSSVGLMVYRMPEASGSHGNTEIQLYTHFAFMHCMVFKFVRSDIFFVDGCHGNAEIHMHYICSKLADESVMIA